MATMPTFTVKMTEQMSNAELADAISAAYNRAGDACEVQRTHKKHMDALLAVQLARASTVRVAEDDPANITGQRSAAQGEDDAKA